eukprot:scaffold52887_cov69-Attheya_sp.AAC.3
MLYRPPQLHFFISEILDWILLWTDWRVLGLVMLGITSYYADDLFRPGPHTYVPKSKRHKVINRLRSWYTYSCKPILFRLFVYINVTIQNLLKYRPFRKANKRKKSPQERQNVAQRPRKLKSRFFYRRTKKWGGQVCSTSPTDMPMALRRTMHAQHESSPKKKNESSPKKKNDEKEEDSCLALPALDSSKKIVEATKLDSDSF